MRNPALDTLATYPFQRVRDLLADLPCGRAEPLDLALGDPQDPIPPMVAAAIAASADRFNRYPPGRGEPAFLAACRDWLVRRYGIPADLIDPAQGILPLSGTKEGLFQTALATVDRDAPGGGPVVLMPSPYYPVYAGAARLAGAAPVYLPADAGNGYLPDFAAVPDDVWARTQLVYFCNPTNPQGSVADRAYLADLIARCRAAGAVLVLDECYAEIYHGPVPPTGGAELAATDPLGLSGILLFHSLSKRSNAAGLRAGFVAGDPALIDALAAVRNYGAAGMPVPVQRAAAALWSDDAHAAAIRAGYTARVALATDRLASAVPGYRAPDAGFFLWLPVPDGEAAVRLAWTKAGIKIVPGAYLAAEDGSGANPGTGFVRVALVHPPEILAPALEALAPVLAEAVAGGRLTTPFAGAAS